MEPARRNTVGGNRKNRKDRRRKNVSMGGNRKDRRRNNAVTMGGKRKNRKDRKKGGDRRKTKKNRRN